MAARTHDMELQVTYGDYEGKAYDSLSSPRMIMGFCRMQ
jgi:hypothetical protein